MNKLLLLGLLGFALIALSGASEKNGENSLTEAESAMEEFEIGELADAEAKKRNGKNNGKKAKKNKRKGRKSNKGKKNRKNKGRKNRKNKGKKNMRKRNKGKKAARQARCDLTCLDKGIKIMKIVQLKITNYKRQSIRVAKQAKLGKGKGEKKGAFKSSLDDLIDAGGGDKSKLMCAGNATNDGAKQMLNLTMTLNNCSDTIKMKCGNESFPTPPEPAVVEACLTDMEKIINASAACLLKTGAEACTCWKDAAFDTAITAIENCTLSVYAKAVAKAKTACVKSFGTCRKYEDAVGKQIHTCNQDSGKLTAKAGAATANKAAIEKVKKVAEALVAKLSGKRTNRGRRAIATCAEFIKASGDLVASITDNPTQDSAAIEAKVKELEAFTGECSASDLAELNAVVAAADAGIAAVEAVLEKLQAAMVALTGAPLSDDALAAAGADAAAGGAAAAGASTSGRMMRRLSIKNVLRNVAKHA